MERTKLIFDHEERTIGTFTTLLDEDGDENEQYLRVFLFNFRVTGTISGPRGSFMGYRLV